MNRISYFFILFLSFSLAVACVNSKKFHSIKILYDKNTGLSPGAAVPFGIMAMDKNDKRVLSKGFLKGKYDLDHYVIEAEGATVEDGMIYIDSSEIHSLNTTFTITAHPLKKPELTDSITVPLNFEGLVNWDFSGDRGKEGKSKGIRLIPVRIAGTGLASGKPGDSGVSGENGLDIHVYIYKIHDDSFFARNGYDAFAVLAKTENESHKKFTYIAQKYGSLKINCNGGNGGKGGDGGPGTDGRDGDATRRAGDGTDGGMGGNGGDGGRGGDVVVHIDSNAQDFLPYLKISNNGGSGGYGGDGGTMGSGGRNTDGTYGTNGSRGRRGQNGTSGRDGHGPEIRIEYVRF